MHYTLGLCYTHAAHCWWVHTHWHVSDQFCLLLPQVKKANCCSVNKLQTQLSTCGHINHFKQDIAFGHTFCRVPDTYTHTHTHTHTAHPCPPEPFSRSLLFLSLVTVKQESVSMATGVIKQTQCAFIHNDMKKHADRHERLTG